MTESSTPALDAWSETHPYDFGSDRPKTSLWFPHEAPYVTLDTITMGGFHDPVERFPAADPKRITCHVHLGPTIDIGGYLYEMEAYFAAVTDALRTARRQADLLLEQQQDGAPDA